MKKIQNRIGASLIGMLIAISLGSFILTGLLYYLRILIGIYKQQMQAIELQYTATLAIQYLSHDIHNAGFKYCNPIEPSHSYTKMYDRPASICNSSNPECTQLLPYDIQQRITKHDIKPNSDILILNSVAENFKVLVDNNIECTPSKILYYLRHSIVHPNTYALYRDDLMHNAVAIAEGFNDLVINSVDLKSHQAINIQLFLLAQLNLAITITTRN